MIGRPPRWIPITVWVLSIIWMIPLIGIVVTLVKRSFVDEIEYVVPAAEVKALEARRHAHL